MYTFDMDTPFQIFICMFDFTWRFEFPTFLDIWNLTGEQGYTYITLIILVERSQKGIADLEKMQHNKMLKIFVKRIQLKLFYRWTIVQ